MKVILSSDYDAVTSSRKNKFLSDLDVIMLRRQCKISGKFFILVSLIFGLSQNISQLKQPLLSLKLLKWAKRLVFVVKLTRSSTTKAKYSV